MKKYTILINPGHNRIYFDTALKIAISELEAISNAYNMNLIQIEDSTIGNKAAITFNIDRELLDEDLKAISFLSIYYALFEVIGEELLKPVIIPDFCKFPESIVQILKYNGKTNEQFTRLMVNIALCTCKTNSNRIILLDPLCGKGTTLYEGFIRGFDVKGIEINDKWTLEIQNFIIRYLKEGRYKHKAKKAKQSNSNGKKLADIFSLTVAAQKKDFESENAQELYLYTSDTRIADLVIKKKSCDIIVSDLPYGVIHGSKNDKNLIASRSPLVLLKEAIPAWYNVLKPKGSMVLSFNEFTIKYKDIKAVLDENGFTVLDEYPYNNYLHRVDMAINRNIIVAVKL